MGVPVGLAYHRRAKCGALPLLVSMVPHFFEDPKERILFIKAEVGAARLKRIDVSGADVDRNALYFNWMSGNKPQQIPSDVPFAVRFISDTPIVVSHRSHTASYHGENR